MTEAESRKLLLKRQAEYRRQGWTSSQLASYARAWTKTHRRFNKQ